MSSVNNNIFLFFKKCITSVFIHDFYSILFLYPQQILNGRGDSEFSPLIPHLKNYLRPDLDLIPLGEVCSTNLGIL